MKDNSLPALLPYRAISPDGVMDLRGCGLMVAYQIHGPSVETNPPAEIAANSRQLAQAFRHLGTGDAVHVLFSRRPAPAPEKALVPPRAIALVEAERLAAFTRGDYWVDDARLYLSHQFPSAIKGWFHSQVFADLGAQHQTRQDLLAEAAQSRFNAFETAASTGIGMRRLSPVETFRAVLGDVVYHDYPALLPAREARLNEIIGCEPFVGGYTPFVNGFHLRPVSITGYPTETVPQILAVLLKGAGYLTISARFICLDAWDAQQALKTEMQHWQRQLMGTIGDMVRNWVGAKRAVADQDSQTMVADLNDAIAAASAGETFGYSTITAIVRDSDSDRALLRANDVVRECHAMGVLARVETWNAVEAIVGSWPGNVDANVRKPKITAANFADLVLPCTLWSGGI